MHVGMSLVRVKGWVAVGVPTFARPSTGHGGIGSSGVGHRLLSERCPRIWFGVDFVEGIDCAR